MPGAGLQLHRRALTRLVALDDDALTLDGRAYVGRHVRREAVGRQPHVDFEVSAHHYERALPPLREPLVFRRAAVPGFPLDFAPPERADPRFEPRFVCRVPRLDPLDAAPPSSSSATSAAPPASCWTDWVAPPACWP